jgi:acetyl/propionyl-CoA carboxylase alpha subunit
MPDASRSELGYPVLLKAVAGGGGKGMRLVADASQMASAWRDATSEALNAFGDAHGFISNGISSGRVT